MVKTSAVTTRLVGLSLALALAVPVAHAQGGASRVAPVLARVPLEAYPEVNSRPQMKERHRIIADLLTMALACDRTRVVHTMFSRGGSNVRYPGVATGHHELSHKIDPTSQDQLDVIVKQIVDEYAYFVSALAAVPEILLEARLLQA